MASLALIWNNLPNTTISVVDSEGKGTNVTNIPFGSAGNLSTMPVPWYNTDFSAHNIQITFEGTNNTVGSGITTIYIWQNGALGSVYWSYTEPPSGGNTSGNSLGNAGGEWILTIGSGFQPTAEIWVGGGNLNHVTSLLGVTNQTDYGISSVYNSQGNGTTVTNLGQGETANTGSMTFPWYTSGPAEYVYVGSFPAFYMWQNGSFIFWSYSQPSEDNCSTSFVLGFEGCEYYLNIDSNFMPSLQLSNSNSTYLLTLVNSYQASVTLSLTDSEGKGANVDALAYGDDATTNNMPVPWYYSPVNLIFANHNIAISASVDGGGGQPLTIYLWQNGNFVYWSYTQPPSGTYTGTILCAAGGAFALTIDSNFCPVAVPVNTAAAQTWAQAFLNENTQFISQFAKAIVAFAAQAVTQTVISDINTFLGTLLPPSLDDLYTQLCGSDNSQYFGSVAALAPASATNLFPYPFTMMVGVSGAATFFAGGEAFAGAAFTLPIPPTTSSLGAGVLSAGVVVGTSTGAGVGFTVAICAGEITEQSGPSISVTFGVEYVAGITVTIGLGVATDPNATGFVVTGISITVDAGAGENLLSVSYDYTQLTNTFTWTAPSVQVAAKGA